MCIYDFDWLLADIRLTNGQECVQSSGNSQDGGNGRNWQLQGMVVRKPTKVGIQSIESF